MTCSIGDIRFVMVKPRPDVSPEVKVGDLVWVEYYRVDEEGRITSFDKAGHDKEAGLKLPLIHGQDYLCTNCQEEYVYWRDVQEHVKPEDE